MKRLIAVLLVLGPPLAAKPRPIVLTERLQYQDIRFRAAFEEVNRWIAERAFPGAVLAVGQHGSLLALKGFGHSEYDPRSPAVSTNEMFDLASLSKVIGTTSAIAFLTEHKKVKLDSPLEGYVPEFGGTQLHDQVTIRELLTHSSGVPTPGMLYTKASNKAGILAQLYTVPLATAPGTFFKYRDPNFILLGELAERVSHASLDTLLQSRIFAPLGMTSTEYRPPAALLDRIAPTEIDQILRHRLVRGEVHDENCYTMGGICGQAGLFSDAHDLAIYAQMMLNGGTYDHHRIFKRKTVKLFTKRQELPAGSSRALGWDTPSPGCFAGELASMHAILHTGFTGTSVYIDFSRDAFVILLTNRVYPTRNNQKITEARPAIHTAVIGALSEE